MSASARGSSPLARGLLVGAGQVHVAPGIIPARAGFTNLVAHPVVAGGDHPRSRGVYVAVDEQARTATGSSPLARGLHQGRQEHRGGRRIIPARAGFTRLGRHGLERHADHPRSRGVYAACDTKKEGPLGSSPLARGLLDHDVDVVPAVRIIPARAGFTRRHRLRRGADPDHPRSRGVYGPSPLHYGGGPGSSPLARGLPRMAAWQISCYRIIPARAGFTAVFFGFSTPS